MYLESAEILNFRGIKHLKISFEPGSSILIGENSWGKSSLLSALWLMLGQGEKLCRFSLDDLYIPLAVEDETDGNQNDDLPLRPLLDFSALDEKPQLFTDEPSPDAGMIAIDLIFAENRPGSSAKSSRLNQLQPAWQLGRDGISRIHWQAEGVLCADGSIATCHRLLNDKLIDLEVEAKPIILKLINMNPVLRIRDSRMGLYEDGMQTETPDVQELAQNLSHLASGDALSSAQIESGLNTLSTIITRYLSNYGIPRPVQHKRNVRGIKDMVACPVSIESLSSLKKVLSDPAVSRTRLLLLFLAGMMLVSKGTRAIDKQAKPILIIEDIDGRFHPSLLLSFWAVAEAIPLQKIVTTNSGDLLSAIPISSLRRLCRNRAGETQSFAINEALFSADELRRIAFHVRLNRPMSLFARSWILVEGETEVWILSAAAAILGISLQSDGIRLIEFAQCGLTPLIKIANQLRIFYHVMADGDDAGRKYAQSTSQNWHTGKLEDVLTVLPYSDLEHFLYASGYRQIYDQASNFTAAQRRGMPVSKIIAQAVKRCSKPALALTVVETMQKRGPEGVPELLRQMLMRIKQLSASETPWAQNEA